MSPVWKAHGEGSGSDDWGSRVSLVCQLCSSSLSLSDPLPTRGGRRVTPDKEMQRAYIDSHGDKFTSKSSRKAQEPMKRGKRLNPRTEAKKLDDVRWKAIKDTFLTLAPLVDPAGVARCNKCGRRADETRLDLHHIVPRSRGGKSDPDNARLLCRSCHEKRHGVPWSKETA